MGAGGKTLIGGGSIALLFVDTAIPGQESWLLQEGGCDASY